MIQEGTEALSITEGATFSAIETGKHVYVPFVETRSKEVGMEMLLIRSMDDLEPCEVFSGNRLLQPTNPQSRMNGTFPLPKGYSRLLSGCSQSLKEVNWT